MAEKGLYVVMVIHERSGEDPQITTHGEGDDIKVRGTARQLERFVKKYCLNCKGSDVELPVDIRGDLCMICTPAKEVTNPHCAGL